MNDEQINIYTHTHTHTHTYIQTHTHTERIIYTKCIIFNQRERTLLCYVCVHFLKCINPYTNTYTYIDLWIHRNIFIDIKIYG